jgi:hypothetical protein
MHIEVSDINSTELSVKQINDVLRSVIQEEASTIEKWLNNESGSWGALAGKAVLACRQKLGRRLSDSERRQVWQLLWEQLQDIRANNKQ